MLVNDDVELMTGGWRESWTVAALALVALVRWGPFLASRPGFLMDDWLFADRARSLGAWETAGAGLSTRPGSRVVYALTFGLTQEPVVLALVLAVCGFLIAVMLWRVALRWMSGGLAAGTACLWLALPTHSALDYWASAIPIAVSMVLFLGGVLNLSVAYRCNRSTVPAAILMVGSVATYELTICLAGLALIFVPLMERRSIRWPSVIMTSGGMAMVAWWIASQAVYRGSRWLDVAALMRLNAMVTPDRPWASFVGWSVVAGCVAMLGLGWSRERSGRPWVPGRLGLVGLILMVAGGLPVARFPWQVAGFGDRVNSATSVGAAVMIVGGLLAVYPIVVARIGIAVLLVTVMVAGSLERSDAYVTAAEAGRAWLGSHPGAPLPALGTDGVYPFCCQETRSEWRLRTSPPLAARSFTEATRGRRSPPS